MSESVEKATNIGISQGEKYGLSGSAYPGNYTLLDLLETLVSRPSNDEIEAHKRGFSNGYYKGIEDREFVQIMEKSYGVSND